MPKPSSSLALRSLVLRRRDFGIEEDYLGSKVLQGQRNLDKGIVLRASPHQASRTGTTRYMSTPHHKGPRSSTKG